VDLGLTSETPVALGMHPNTEISYRTDQCNMLFGALCEILPRDTGSKDEGDDEEKGGGGGGASSQLEDKISNILDRVDSEPDEKNPGRRYNVAETRETLPREGRKPWQNVLVMELE